MSHNPFDDVKINQVPPTFSGFGWSDICRMTMRGGEVCRFLGSNLYRFRILEFQLDGQFEGVLVPWFFSASGDSGQTWWLAGLSALCYFGGLMVSRGISISDTCRFIIKGDGRIFVFGRNSFEVLIIPPSATNYLLPASEIQLPAGATLESLVPCFAGGQIPNEIVSRFKAKSLPNHESSPDGKTVTVWVAANVSAVMLKKGSSVDRLSIHRRGRVSYLFTGDVDIASVTVGNSVRHVVIRLPCAPKRIEPMDNGSLRFIF